MSKKYWLNGDLDPMGWEGGWGGGGGGVGGKFFHFRVEHFSEGNKTILKELPCLKVYQCPLTLLLLHTTCPILANSVDPDQLASEEANWSRFALFVIKYVNFYQKIQIKYSDWLEIRSGHGILIYSAWQGLMLSTLGIIFSRRHFEIFFLCFWENRSWHFIQWRQFAWNT